MEQKYYYAQIVDPVDPNYYDPEMYYSDEDAEYERIWIGGNRDFRELNEDLRQEIVELLSNMSDDLDTIDPDEEDQDGNILSIDTAAVNIAKYYSSQYLKKHKINNKLTNEDLNILISYAQEWNDTQTRDENDLICDTLSLLWDEEFKNDELSGDSQGDWAEIIYPAEIEERINWIEAWYMGTGVVLNISETKCSLEELENGDVETYDVLAPDSWKPKLYKFVADNCGCRIDEVKILDEQGEEI